MRRIGRDEALSDMGILHHIDGPMGPLPGLNLRDGGANDARPRRTAAAAEVHDRLELSDAAVRLAQLDDRPNEHVERVRREIEAGTYESDQRIDATIERLFADLTAFETHI